MDSPRGEEPPVGLDAASVVTRGVRVPEPSVAAVLDTERRPRFAWQTADETVLVRGAAAQITADGRDRFSTVRDAADRLFESSDVAADIPFAARPRLFGGFAFHEGAGDGDPWTGFPDAAFVLPAVQLTEVDGEWWLTVTSADGRGPEQTAETLEEWRDRLAATRAGGGSAGRTAGPPGVEGRRPTPSRAGWREQVRAALDGVAAGDLTKVVLSQSLALSLSGPLSVPDALDRLGRAYPDCLRFAFTPAEGGTFFGATPERLVSLRGRDVETAAIAGSTGRGDTPAEDEWLAGELRESEKDRHEHELVVDAIRDQLSPYASTVSTGDRKIRRLDTVQHLETPISADLATDEHVLSLVEALHPTPAVGGLPPDAALRTIRDSEAFDRGWYAAPIGWFDAAGDGTFAVAIRSGVAAERTATVFAGAGIVADSDPDEEWDELQLKFEPMLSVLR